MNNFHSSSLLRTDHISCVYGVSRKPMRYDIIWNAAYGAKAGSS